MKKKAQASVEMAIFGSIILVCFAALLSYGLRLNEEQALKMDAFRLALQKAGVVNGFVSYTVTKNKGLVNLYNFFNPRSAGFSASATVMWAKGEPENRSYYRINDNEIELERYEKDGQQVPVEVWDIQTEQVSDYSERTDKGESRQGIGNYQEGTLTDTIETTLKSRAEPTDDNYEDRDDIVLSQRLYVNNEGKLAYSQEAYNQDTRVVKSRTWSTPW